MELAPGGSILSPWLAIIGQRLFKQGCENGPVRDSSQTMGGNGIAGSSIAEPRGQGLRHVAGYAREALSSA